MAAVQTDLMVTAGWMIADGEWGSALTVVLVGAREHLAVPIVLLLAGGVFLTVIAGRRRAPSDDFDLACVALVPLVVVELANALLFRLGVDAQAVGIYLGYAWFSVLMGLAFLQTRSREGDRA